MEIVLASASDRRKELLGRLVEDFTTIVSDFDETSVNQDCSIEDYVKKIASGKAQDVLKSIEKDSIIVAADTVVVFNYMVIGKPKDKEDAYSILRKLSGNTHVVYTGLALINTKTKKIIKDIVKTEVKFSALSDDEIYKYIDTGEPMDKAGAYGIQGKGGVLVEEIKGCYYNVVGLPLNRLKKMLLEII